MLFQRDICFEKVGKKVRQNDSNPARSRQNDFNTHFSISATGAVIGQRSFVILCNHTLVDRLNVNNLCQQGNALVNRHYVVFFFLWTDVQLFFLINNLFSGHRDKSRHKHCHGHKETSFISSCWMLTKSWQPSFSSQFMFTKISKRESCLLL